MSQLDKRHALYVKPKIYCRYKWNHKSCQKCNMNPVTEALKLTMQVIQILKFNHGNNSLMLETYKLYTSICFIQGGGVMVHCHPESFAKGMQWGLLLSCTWGTYTGEHI